MLSHNVVQVPLSLPSLHSPPDKIGNITIFDHPSLRHIKKSPSRTAAQHVTQPALSTF